jgi:hypothetical protein
MPSKQRSQAHRANVVTIVFSSGTDVKQGGE